MNTQQKAQWLAGFWASVARGEKWQEHMVDAWFDFDPENNMGATMYSDLDNWRRKPEPIVRWTLRKEGVYPTFLSIKAAKYHFGHSADLVKLVEA